MKPTATSGGVKVGEGPKCTEIPSVKVTLFVRSLRFGQRCVKPERGEDEPPTQKMIVTALPFCSKLTENAHSPKTAPARRSWELETPTGGGVALETLGIGRFQSDDAQDRQKRQKTAGDSVFRMGCLLIIVGVRTRWGCQHRRFKRVVLCLQ